LLSMVKPQDVFGLFARSPYSILIVLGVFVGVGTLARYWASSQTSRGVQYLGLAVYVVLEALIIFPLLCIAHHYAGPEVIPTAGILTLAMFAGLTAVVFITKKDFNFLGSLLTVCSFIALGVILVAIVVPGSIGLGKFFTIAMILLMAGYILYDTSNVMHHYDTDQHVAAALALFASIATLFYYILRLLLILIFLAVLLASGLYGAVRFFERFLPRILAVLVSYALLIGAFVLVIFLIFPPQRL